MIGGGEGVVIVVIAVVVHVVVAVVDDLLFFGAFVTDTPATAAAISAAGMLGIGGAGHYRPARYLLSLLLVAETMY